MSASRLAMQITPTPGDQAFFARLNPVLGRAGFRFDSSAWSRTPKAILVRDRPGMGATIPWPSTGFVGIAGDWISLSFEPLNRSERPFGLQVSTFFQSQGLLGDIELVFSVPCFMRCYTEGQRDMMRRVLRIVELLRDLVHVSSGACYCGTERPWFQLEDGNVVERPLMPLEAIARSGLRHLDEWMQESRGPLSRDLASGDIVITYCEAGKARGALLRVGPLDGCQLPASPRDDSFWPVDEETELSYQQLCWPAADGIEELSARFGPPDIDLGGYNQPPRANRPSILRQVAYTGLEERWVVLLREYEGHRVIVNLLGKQRE